MDARKERYKRIRGAALKLLAHQHPGSVDDKVLFFLLDDMRYSVSDEEYESMLSYLTELRLLRVEKKKTSGVEIRMVSITAKGLDVLDGFECAPGVDVNF